MDLVELKKKTEVLSSSSRNSDYNLPDAIIILQFLFCSLRIINLKTTNFPIKILVICLIFLFVHHSHISIHLETEASDPTLGLKK